ncbi:MAG: EutN/CcmL family microcompartment protein [Planctomycetes bacterium]|nr:EutN/CcmL family microcompartment protein [Planctomycetota bacterium]
MQLGRIIGRVWASAKDRHLANVKLLLVEPLDERREISGDAFVACDVAQSGEGDVVYYVEGYEAAFALPGKFAPTDRTIVAHVDGVNVTEQKFGDRAYPEIDD